ncbi:unnamed protein product [Choristocarpus tenellus]
MGCAASKSNSCFRRDDDLDDDMGRALETPPPREERMKPLSFKTVTTAREDAPSTANTDHGRAPIDENGVTGQGISACTSPRSNGTGGSVSGDDGNEEMKFEDPPQRLIGKVNVAAYIDDGVPAVLAPADDHERFRSLADPSSCETSLEDPPTYSEVVAPPMTERPVPEVGEDGCLLPEFTTCASPGLHVPASMPSVAVKVEEIVRATSLLNETKSGVTNVLPIKDHVPTVAGKVSSCVAAIEQKRRNQNNPAFNPPVRRRSTGNVCRIQLGNPRAFDPQLLPSGLRPRSPLGVSYFSAARVKSVHPTKGSVDDNVNTSTVSAPDRMVSEPVLAVEITPEVEEVEEVEGVEGVEETSQSPEITDVVAKVEEAVFLPDAIDLDVEVKETSVLPNVCSQ